MPEILQVGDWGLARRILQTSPVRIQRAMDIAVQQEAHYFRQKVVEGMREQAPGGRSFKPLAALTLALRKLRGFRGTKALMVRGDLRNSITVQRMGTGAAFVGVLRSARGKDGQSLVNIAEINEFGSRPIIIHITQKMREVLGRASKLMGKDEAPRQHGGDGGSPSIMVIRIPARPFLQPVADKYFQPGEVKMRFLARVGRALGGDFGQVGIPIPTGRAGEEILAGATGSAAKASAAAAAAASSRIKDPKRVAAALLGWQRRRTKGK